MSATESKTKHTPGPWRPVWDYTSGVVIRGPKTDNASVLVAELSNVVEREANARLIAQAPAMVEVLKDELADLDDWLSEEGIPDSVKSAMLIREDRIGRVLSDAGMELHG